MTWRRRMAASFVCMSLATACVAQTAYRSDADLAAAVLPSVVNIYQRHVETSQSMRDGVMVADPPIVHDEVGTGFIVEESGIIVTNRHVIENAYSLSVTLSDGTHVPAKLIGKALTFDIALIKIDVGRPLPVVKIGDSAAMRVADRVIAIGNPLGFADSVSAGIISAFHRTGGLSAYDDLIQTDATINQGNSGGPLFNAKGEVIGINQAIYTRNQGGSIGIGFAIPIDQVKDLLSNVRTMMVAAPRFGWLGVNGQTLTPGMAAALRCPKCGGVILSDIAANSPAEAAGLRVGDAILKVADQDTPTLSALNRAVSEHADRKVDLQLFRDGRSQTISVAIGKWPEELWSTKMPAPPKLETPADLGLTLSPAPTPDGPLVASVVEKSIAWSAGLRAGDTIARVQSTEMRSQNDLMTAVRDLSAVGQNSALILLKGPNGTRWVELSVRE